MGSASPGPIQGFDPMLKMKAPIKRKLFSTKTWDKQFRFNSPAYNYKLPESRPKKLRDIIGRDFKNERKADKR